MQNLKDAQLLLSKAKRIVALCGAGLSADSGLRTFRDPKGYWKEYRPEDLATPEAFDRDSDLVWAWYRARIDQAREAIPNRGHHALSALARMKSTTLITQNVDGLQQRAEADYPEDSVPEILELHGNLLRAHCERCGKSLDESILDRDVKTPICPCGSRFRPSVVWFGEGLNPVVFDRATECVQEADLFLSIGTSAHVWPAAGFLPLAKRQNCPILEINPDSTAMSHLATYCLTASAREALPALLEDLEFHGS